MSYNSLNNLSLAQSLGLLTAGAGLLEGQGFGQSVQGGLGAYSMLDKMEQEKRRRALLDQLLGTQTAPTKAPAATPTKAPAATPTTMPQRTPRLPAAVGLGQIGDAAGLNEYQRNQLAGAQMMQQQAGAKGLMMTPSGFQRMPQPIPVPAGVPTTPPAPAAAPTAAPAAAPTTASGVRLTPQARQIAAALPTDQALAFLAKEANKAYTGALVQLMGPRGNIVSVRQDDPKLDQYIAANYTLAAKPSAGSARERSFNRLINMAPAIAAGTASPDQVQRYSLDYQDVAKPTVVTSYDEDGNEIRTRVPGINPAAAGLPPIPGVDMSQLSFGQATTKPSAQTLKDTKFKKDMNVMALNINKYEDAVNELGFLSQARGVLGFADADAAKAKAAAETLRLDLKELNELGALVGGDFQILDNQLSNIISGQALLQPALIPAQIEMLKDTLENKVLARGGKLQGLRRNPYRVETREEYEKVPNGAYVEVIDPSTGQRELRRKLRK